MDDSKDFYNKVSTFFKKNKLAGNKEVTFLYYWDFFENFEQVSNWINELIKIEVLSDELNIWVWIRSNSKINKKVLSYLLEYKRSWILTLKFSLDMWNTYNYLIKSIETLFSSFLVISKLVFNKNINYIVQLNNIDNSSLSSKEKAIINTYLKKITDRFNFVELIYSNYDIKKTFLDFDNFDKCIYYWNHVEYWLKKNEDSKNDIFIDHVDLLKDSIRLHNLYCKKLKSNYFGTLDSDVTNINAELNKFIYWLDILHKEYENNDYDSICNYCNDRLDNIFEDLNKNDDFNKIMLN